MNLFDVANLDSKVARINFIRHYMACQKILEDDAKSCQKILTKELRK